MSSRLIMLQVASEQEQHAERPLGMEQRRHNRYFRSLRHESSLSKERRPRRSLERDLFHMHKMYIESKLLLVSHRSILPPTNPHIPLT